jgi:uncharacterized membrane protein
MGRWAGLAISLLGMVNAVAFTLAYYRVIPRSALSLPVICDIQGHVCGDVLDSPYARVFLLPNSAYGIAFYAIWIAWAAAGMPTAWAGLVLAATAASFAMSVYLAWALIFRVKVICRLCFAGHGINALLFAQALLLSVR